MARTLICKCDKCGNEVPNTELLEVKFFVSTPRGYETKVFPTIEWCRTCVEQRGIFFKPAKPPTEEQEQLTIDEIIRDIVAHEVALQQPQQ